MGEYSVHPDISARPLDINKSDKVEKPLNRKCLSKISKSSMKKAMRSRCPCSNLCVKKKVISRAHENAIVKIPDGYVLLNNYLARMKNYIREVSESSKNI